MNRYPEGLPCWAPGAADHLASILTGNEVGFEWGGGASSLWLVPQIRYLYVMETDPRWAEKIITDTEGKHCGVWVRNFEDPDYIHRAREPKPRPNLWLIDGYRRIDCLDEALRLAKKGDIMVCDDALDYAAQCFELYDVTRFAMPHPHAGQPCVSEKNTRHRNTVRKTAPKTKETWIWVV